jgi:hypothetical protein
LLFGRASAESFLCTLCEKEKNSGAVLGYACILLLIGILMNPPPHPCVSSSGAVHTGLLINPHPLRVRSPVEPGRSPKESFGLKKKKSFGLTRLRLVSAEVAGHGNVY